jgi:hypothetical protein
VVEYRYHWYLAYYNIYRKGEPMTEESKIAIEIAIEPMAPYKVADVEHGLAEDIRQAAKEAGATDLAAGKGLSVQTERRLPTKEQLEAIKLALEIAIMAGGPLIAFLKGLIARLQKKGRVRVLKVKVDGQEIAIPLEWDSLSVAVEEVARQKQG